MERDRGPITIGEVQAERYRQLVGVLDETVVVHQWGVVNSPNAVEVLHHVAVDADQDDGSLGSDQEHLNAAIATLVERSDIHPGLVTYLGPMTKGEAARELSTLPGHGAD